MSREITEPPETLIQAFLNIHFGYLEDKKTPLFCICQGTYTYSYVSCPMGGGILLSRGVSTTKKTVWYSFMVGIFEKYIQTIDLTFGT